MTKEQRDEITTIAKEFVEGLLGNSELIGGTGWIAADPLSGYLNATGFTHEIGQYPATDNHPQVLVMTFPDGSRFMPAGGDFKPLDERFENYMWVLPE